MENKNYREYFFTGREFIDENGCDVPKEWSSEKRLRILGYTDDKQRFYLRGPGVNSYFACTRFLRSGSDPKQVSSEMAAYDCCVARSRNVMCIESRGLNGSFGRKSALDKKFCQLGKKCSLDSVSYEVYQGKQPNKLCARTVSLCPYDHLLGGGTEDEKPSESQSGGVISSR